MGRGLPISAELCLTDSGAYRPSYNRRCDGVDWLLEAEGFVCQAECGFLERRGNIQALTFLPARISFKDFNNRFKALQPTITPKMSSRTLDPEI
jgi:hypothetical protein